MNYIPKDPINHKSKLDQLIGALQQANTLANVDQDHWCYMLSLDHNDLTLRVETKWPPFSKQHFQMHFHEWKVVYFD